RKVSRFIREIDSVFDEESERSAGNYPAVSMDRVLFGVRRCNAAFFGFCPFWSAALFRRFLWFHFPVEQCCRRRGGTRNKRKAPEARRPRRGHTAASCTCSNRSGGASRVPLHLGYLLHPRKKPRRPGRSFIGAPQSGQVSRTSTCGTFFLGGGGISLASFSF